MPNFVLGENCVAYYDATTVTASDNATLLTAITAAASTGVISNVKDLKINLTADKADISTRAGAGWKATVPTLKDGSVTFGMLWKPGDVNFAALLAAYLAGSEVFFAALDGVYSVSGNQGIAGNFTVSNFSRNEPLTGAVEVEVELSPSSFTGWFKHA